jgi:hypothetical protein
MMRNVTDTAQSWGKRACPDDGFDHHDSGKGGNSSPIPPTATQGLNNLPTDILGQLIRWLDARVCAQLEICSRRLRDDVRTLRWMNAGPVFVGARVTPQASEQRRASDRWLYRENAKVFHQGSGWSDLSTRFPEDVDGGHDTLRTTGRGAGYRFDHINADSCYQPVVEGIVQARGWRSLSLCYRRADLQQGLDGLAVASITHGPTVGRDLILTVSDCSTPAPFRYPDKLRADGLNVVELHLDDVVDPEEFLSSFKHARSLLRLGVDLEESVGDPAVVLEAIGDGFPDLAFFRLSAYQPFGIAPELWSRFHHHHPKLDVLILQNLDLGLHSAALDFTDLRVRDLILHDFFPADPEGRLAAWVAGSYSLDCLEIELEAAAFPHGDSRCIEVRDQWLRAIAANPALTKLSLKGEGWTMQTGRVRHADTFLALLNSLADRAQLTALQIPAFNIKYYEDILTTALILRDGPLMPYLEALEKRLPKLSLTLGEFTLSPLLHTIAIPGNHPELVAALDQWPAISQKPGEREILSFSVRLSTWGEGAFRRFIDFCILRADDRERYLLSLAKEGHLVEGSLRIEAAE